MSVLANGAYFWRSALQGMRRSPFIHLVAIVTLAIALFVVGLVRGGSLFVERLVHSLDDEVQLTVYLDKDATPDDVHAAAQAATRLTGFPAREVTPEEALNRLTAELGDTARVLRDLPKNPLPATLEIQVPPGQRSSQALKKSAELLLGAPHAASVDYGAEAVERLEAIARLLTLGGAFALGIVFIATMVIVSATLQLAIYARREEVEIQKLVGATDGFVKAPFLIEGLLQGVFGGAGALAGLFFFFEWAGPKVFAALSFLRAAGVGGSPLSATLALEILALGAVLGLGGSFVAVGRFLKV